MTRTRLQAPVTGQLSGWSVGLGAGQALPGVFFAQRATDQDHATALSTMAQTFGFFLGATGPVLAAILHGTSDTWLLPLAALIAVLLLCAVAGLRADRDPE